jgi:NTE family protein
MTGRAGRDHGIRDHAIRGLAGPRAEKTVALALQGGGAHGAFTWGVLDALMEDGRVAVEAITGASAGAMNAVVLVEGFAEAGIDGARTHLERFWRRVSLDGSLSSVQRGLFDRFFGYWSGQAWGDLLARMASPYETNPLNINPLRDALDDLIDFERVRACDRVQVFVAATNVWTGKIAVFERPMLTADHVMASACLPTVFQAVEIEGVPYWDGGYLGNPPLYPLYYQTVTDDVLLVQINPVERRETPRTAQEIHNRLNEITFNGNLLRELRGIDFVTRLIEDGKLTDDRYKRVLMHRIDGSGVLDDYEASSRLNAEWDFFLRLRDAGRATAKGWLERHYDAIGHEGTLDLREAYQ